MKVAALSFYSTNDAFSAWRGRAPEFADEQPRDRERRRKPRVAEAVRLSPTPRLATGLAVQVIAQIERATARRGEQIEAARAAYRPQETACGAVVNFKA